MRESFVLNHLPQVPPEKAYDYASRLALMWGTQELYDRARPARVWRKIPDKPAFERAMELREAKLSVAEAEKIMRKEGYFGRSHPRFY